MFGKATKFALIVPLIAAFAVASTPADARGGGGGGRGGGGFGGGRGGGFSGGGFSAGRSAPMSINRPSGVGNVSRGDVGGNRVNRGNVNVGNNVNVGVDRDWSGAHDYGRYPIGAGVAAGVVAGAAAASIGSTYYALPPDCSAYGTSYYNCGGVYYQPQYEGTNVTYMVVEKPAQ